VIDARMSTVMSGTYMPTACALNPYVQYSLGTSQTVMAVMRNGLEKTLNTNSAAIALQEFETFRTKQGEFSSDIARRMAIDHRTSPAAWWATFGEIHQCCKGWPDACYRGVQPLVDVKGTGAPLHTSTPNCATG